MNIEREVAEKVMGWKICTNTTWGTKHWGRTDGNPTNSIVYQAWPRNDWHPLTDMNQCMEVLEMCGCERWDVWCHDDRSRKTYHCELVPFDERDKVSYAEADTPNEAILKAALEVVG